jgi:hypothetical protein
MPLLLDTYNITHAGAGLSPRLAELSVRGLCRLLSARPGRQRVTLVLDGRPKPSEPRPGEFPDLELVYSADASADDVIVELVERGRHRRAITVITSDRALTRQVRESGGQVTPSRAFLESLLIRAGRQMMPHKPRPQPPRHSEKHLPAGKTHGIASAGETELWLRRFGFLPTETPAPAKPKARPAPEPKPDDELHFEIDMKKLLGF